MKIFTHIRCETITYLVGQKGKYKGCSGRVMVSKSFTILYYFLGLLWALKFYSKSFKFSIHSLNTKIFSITFLRYMKILHIKSEWFKVQSAENVAQGQTICYYASCVNFTYAKCKFHIIPIFISQSTVKLPCKLVPYMHQQCIILRTRTILNRLYQSLVTYFFISLLIIFNSPYISWSYVKGMRLRKGTSIIFFLRKFSLYDAPMDSLDFLFLKIQCNNATIFSFFWYKTMQQFIKSKFNSN